MQLELTKFKTTELQELLKSVKQELALRQEKKQLPEMGRKKALLAVENYHARGGEFKPEIEAVFGRFLCSMPVNNRENFQSKRAYLRCILSQDWSHLFSGYKSEDRRYYVYAHIDPRRMHFACQEINLIPGSGEPFYIGKGTGRRAWDLDRNQGHGKTLLYLKEKGYTKDHIVKVLFENMTEAESMEMEAKLIYFFGTLYEKNRRGTLVNLDLSIRPNFIAAMGKKLSPKLESLAKAAGMPLPDPNAWRLRRDEKLAQKAEQNA